MSPHVTTNFIRRTWQSSSFCSSIGYLHLFWVTLTIFKFKFASSQLLQSDPFVQLLFDVQSFPQLWGPSPRRFRIFLKGSATTRLVVRGRRRRRWRKVILLQRRKWEIGGDGRLRKGSRQSSFIGWPWCAGFLYCCVPVVMCVMLSRTEKWYSIFMIQNRTNS